MTACSRCRSRKQRCDPTPAGCSNCDRAGVPCVNTDADGRSAPRSYIRNLEDRVAHLEAQLASHGISISELSPESLAPRAPNESGELPIHHELHESGPSHVTNAQSLLNGHSVQLPRGMISQSLLHSLLRGPVSDLGQPTDHRPFLRELPFETRASLPSREAAQRLVDTYFEHTEFFSPVISSKEDLLASLEQLYAGSIPSDESGSLTALHRFRVFAVFATAVLLLNRTDSSFPISRAEGYFATAIHVFAQYPDLLCACDSSHLCNLLLIIQYSCFASDLTAVWHFLGLATRLAIDLGLHHERPATTEVDPEENKRRWLFWTTYTFERTVCVIIDRPFSIPDEAITTSLPILQGVDDCRFLALRLIESRRLESEIYVTLRQSLPVNGAVLDLPTWRENMRQRLMTWRASAPSSLVGSSQLAPLDLYDALLHKSLIDLYYPSTSLTDLSHHDALILATSAAASIGGIKQAFRDGRLRFYWRAAHNLFKAGVAMVFCIHHQIAHGSLNMDHADMVASVNTCVSILWGMVERYPAGKVYRDVFEGLSNSVLSSLGRSPGNGQAQSGAGLHDVLTPNLIGGFDLPQEVLDTLSSGFTGWEYHQP
ncbi:hypothetical protein NW759_011387 [Fusarium solani]|nr:hypothetical protein NW759_011387 [Fusarium solani]